MPYTVGTYTDKMGSMSCLLDGRMQSQAECERAICGQVTSGEWDNRCCHQPMTGAHDKRTAWHICDPLPGPRQMKCRSCGETMTVVRGGYFTWAAFHKHCRRIWGDAVPLTEAEFRTEVEGF
jgi:hypothetical protein